jgi:glycosyltransferase involved in cell wall biosynthesis
MLVCGRPEMTARAIRSFEAQSYEQKELIHFENSGERSIGLLRNQANALATGDIICHFDTDDYSHPNRISEQVALLQSSGADCVGYRDMLFWREKQIGWMPDSGKPLVSRMIPRVYGEAWLFTGPYPHYALGTSLCYWRKTWERRPFLNENQGVEEKWCAELAVASTSCFPHEQDRGQSFDPRMIASIHGGNTSTGYDLEKHVAMGSQQWRRAPIAWDDYCRERMGL